MRRTGSIAAALGAPQGKALDQKNNFVGYASPYTAQKHMPLDNYEKVGEPLHSGTCTESPQCLAEIVSSLTQKPFS